MSDNTPDILDQPLTPTELERLDQILFDAGDDGAMLGMSEVDGFLTAVVSAPNVILPSQWYPLIWGGTGAEPEWESESAYEEFISLLMRHQNAIIDMLLNGDFEDYAPLFTSSEHEQHGEVWQAEDWCAGYLFGASLWQGPELSEEMQPYMGVIMLHGSDEHAHILDDMTFDAQQETVEDVVLASFELYQYWLVHRARTSAPSEGRFVDVRQNPKVGRNEACPCGSGKKYKKCCLH